MKETKRLPNSTIVLIEREVEAHRNVGFRGICLSTAALLIAAASVCLAQAPGFVRYPIPTSGGIPGGITSGPDGNLWFTELYGNKIGKITTSGVITEFSVPTAASFPDAITAGPDGNLWFTEGASTSSKIGRISPAGVITEFQLSPAAYSYAITAGPDGNLWFVEGSNNRIGRITPSGVVSEFKITGGPSGITTGPDGNLWFTESAGIGKITISGTITEYPAPNVSPSAITAGLDGNLWFTDQGNGRIGKITTAGVITEFPARPCQQAGIALGLDGALWFTEQVCNAIGRITTAGVITEFPLPGTGFPSTPFWITPGPDGNLWFTDANTFSGNIYKVTLNRLPPAVPAPPSFVLLATGIAVLMGWSGLCALQRRRRSLVLK